MFGINVTLITKNWEHKGSIRCVVVPHRGEYIFISEFNKYVIVVNVVHQTSFWGTKVLVIVEDVTTNLPINGEKSEE